MMDVHRVAAWGVMALIPWKIGISWRSLKRGLDRRFNRSIMIVVSLLLAILAVLTLLFGFMWAFRIGPEELLWRQPTIAWHWILALVLLAPLALHVWRRWPRPKWDDFTARRSALRMLGITAAGIAGWFVASRIAEARAEADHPRLITGSRLQGKLTGNAFPLTGEYPPTINIKTWQLVLNGSVTQPITLDYASLLAMPPHDWVATLDCTNGWYSEQVWSGVRLADLLDSANLHEEGRAVRLRSATGYVMTFPLIEARQILLATHVGGEALAEWHGYPVRAVAPFRRGWYWVKWLSEITVLADLG
jgi:hypothetical protein